MSPNVNKLKRLTSKQFCPSEIVELRQVETDGTSVLCFRQLETVPKISSLAWPTMGLLFRVRTFSGSISSFDLVDVPVQKLIRDADENGDVFIVLRWDAIRDYVAFEIPDNPESLIVVVVSPNDHDCVDRLTDAPAFIEAPEACLAGTGLSVQAEKYVDALSTFVHAAGTGSLFEWCYFAVNEKGEWELKTNSTAEYRRCFYSVDDAAFDSKRRFPNMIACFFEQAA